MYIISQVKTSAGNQVNIAIEKGDTFKIVRDGGGLITATIGDTNAPGPAFIETGEVIVVEEAPDIPELSSILVTPRYPPKTSTERNDER